MTEEDARARLNARFAQIEEELALGAEMRAPVTLQQDTVGRLSRMDAIQQQQMAEAKRRRREAEQARIRAALERLDAGEWGWCLTCGDRIAEARLAHDPSVTQCVKCASGED